MNFSGGMVANHASWLDIFSINALDRVYFVAKSEVARWFGIGWLARATGTVFVERRATAAKRQEEEFLGRLKAGHKLLFFPEGTSTDGIRVLAFKPTLFSAFFDTSLIDVWIQPITQIYTAPTGYDHRYFGWWGNAEFGPHFQNVLAATGGGRVEVIFHEPLKVSDFEDRKSLALKAEQMVRLGLEIRQVIAA